MSLLDLHSVPAVPPPPSSSAVGLDSPIYAVAWEHLVRPVSAPCGHWRVEDGVKVPVGHFLTADGGCWYGCEEET